MAQFFCSGSEIWRPEEIIPFLAGAENHWRKGRSAYELAHSWMGARGIPLKVANVLDTQEGFQGSRLLEGHFERDTKIPGRGKSSQTDFLAICKDNEGDFILGVEGKVDETLGPLVREWDNGTPNRQTRLKGLVDLLGGELNGTPALRYQLLHRTAAAVVEARSFGFRRAVMLVHSFDPNHAWFEDFRAFSEWLGAPCPSPGRLSDPKSRDGVELSIGWCADLPSP